MIYFMYPLSGMFSSHKGVLRVLKMKWQWVSLVHGPQKVNSCDYILIFGDFWILNLSTSLILFITGCFAHKSVFCYLKCIYKIEYLVKARDSRFPRLVCLSSNTSRCDVLLPAHQLHSTMTTQPQWRRLSPAPPPSGLGRWGRRKLAQTTRLALFGP